MPYVTLMDLIVNCPNELVAGSIIVYDWCHRVLQPIEHIDVNCEDIQNCIDCEYILSQLQFGPGFIVGGWEMPCLIGLDPSYINTVVTAEFDCETGMLTIGNNAPIDLSCIADFRGFTFMDGLNNYTVANGDMIFVQWLHGMQCVVGNQLIQVDLPSGATNSQVLTWSTVNNAAYRANPLEICCDQIMDCVQPYIDGLQSQINVLSSLLCPCGWEAPVYALSVYEEGLLVHGAVSMINFLGNCLIATWNAMTGMVDVTLSIAPVFTCTTENGIPVYTLTICDQEVDLSCIATTSLLTVMDEGSIIGGTHNLNFVGDCISATINALDPSIIDITLDTNLAWSGCEWETPYILSLCWDSVDLSCLAPQEWPLYVYQTVFVMKNGNDTTGLVERFDKPFLTIQAAINAAEAAIVLAPTNIFTVIVYPGVYDGQITLKNQVNLQFMKWTTITGWWTTYVSNFLIDRSDVICKVAGNVDMIVPTSTSETTWKTYGIYVAVSDANQQRVTNCHVEFNIDKVEIIGGTSVWDISIFFAGASNSQFRFISGSIKTLWCSALLTYFKVNGGCTLDAVSGYCKSLPEKHRFYAVAEWGKLRWHDSIVDLFDISATPYTMYANTANGTFSGTVVEEVNIRGNYSNALVGAAMFYTWDSNTQVFKNFTIDMWFGVSGTANQICFLTGTLWTIEFHDMNQFFLNNMFDRTNDGWAASTNIFGRILTNRTVTVAALDTHTFNGIENYEVTAADNLNTGIMRPMYDNS